MKGALHQWRSVDHEFSSGGVLLSLEELCQVWENNPHDTSVANFEHQKHQTQQFVSSCSFEFFVANISWLIDDVQWVGQSSSMLLNNH